MEVYELSKSWPSEERSAWTDQIRRASRSVCANLAEAWRKRSYPKHFAGKLTDAEAEAAETRVWLQFAHRCGYLTQEELVALDQAYNVLCGGLVKMRTAPDQWRTPTIREDAAPYESAASNHPLTPAPSLPLRDTAP